MFTEAAAFSGLSWAVPLPFPEAARGPEPGKAPPDGGGGWAVPVDLCWCRFARSQRASWLEQAQPRVVASRDCRRPRGGPAEDSCQRVEGGRREAPGGRRARRGGGFQLIRTGSPGQPLVLQAPKVPSGAKALCPPKAPARVAAAVPSGSAPCSAWTPVPESAPEIPHSAGPEAAWQRAFLSCPGDCPLQLGRGPSADSVCFPVCPCVPSSLSSRDRRPVGHIELLLDPSVLGIRQFKKHNQKRPFIWDPAIPWRPPVGAVAQSSPRDLQAGGRVVSRPRRLTRPVPSGCGTS